MKRDEFPKNSSAKSSIWPPSSIKKETDSIVKENVAKKQI